MVARAVRLIVRSGAPRVTGAGRRAAPLTAQPASRSPAPVGVFAGLHVSETSRSHDASIGTPIRSVLLPFLSAQRRMDGTLESPALDGTPVTKRRRPPVDEGNCRRGGGRGQVPARTGLERANGSGGSLKHAGVVSGPSTRLDGGRCSSDGSVTAVGIGHESGHSHAAHRGGSARNPRPRPEFRRRGARRHAHCLRRTRGHHKRPGTTPPAIRRVHPQSRHLHRQNRALRRQVGPHVPLATGDDRTT